MNKIAIIILNWNGKNDTIECVRSCQKITYPNYEILLVDNGSTDGSVETLRKEFPSIALLETGENLGFAGGNNVGIRHALASCDSVLILNNDTIVDPDILDGFARAAQDPKIGILGAHIYLYGDRDHFDHLGGTWNSKTANFDLAALRAPIGDANWAKSLELDYVCGCALFVKKELFEKIGLLEPSFFLFWEEADFCFRARRGGFAVKTCPEARLWHKGSASFSGKPHSTYFWWRGRFLWMRRNCSRLERLRLYATVLLPEICKTARHLFLKTLQHILLSPFKKDLSKNRGQRQRSRAALCGVKDALLGHYGNGPSWLFKTQIKEMNICKK